MAYTGNQECSPFAIPHAGRLTDPGIRDLIALPIPSADNFPRSASPNPSVR